MVEQDCTSASNFSKADILLTNVIYEKCMLFWTVHIIYLNFLFVTFMLKYFFQIFNLRMQVFLDYVVFTDSLHTSII